MFLKIIWEALVLLFAFVAFTHICRRDPGEETLAERDGCRTLAAVYGRCRWMRAARKAS